MLYTFVLGAVEGIGGLSFLLLVSTHGEIDTRILLYEVRSTILGLHLASRLLAYWLRVLQNFPVILSASHSHGVSLRTKLVILLVQ